MIVDNVIELIGKTPMLKMNRYMEKYHLHANILAKLEFFNPLGSVKERTALRIILDAEDRGYILEGTTLIEATSGNTGIGLALVAAMRNYKIIITMPDNMSEERISMLKALGAQVILTPSRDGMQGSIIKSKELSKQIPNSFLTRQFSNDSNVRAHIITTGKEILDDTQGNVDVFVACVGTGGTITGVGTILKTHDPKIKIIAVEPSGSPVLSKGLKGSHKIQGIGAGFVPEILDVNLIDEVITVTDTDAFNTTKEILQVEGLFAGISSGAAVYAARQIAKRREFHDKNIVVILPDTGFRYMSTKVFE